MEKQSYIEFFNDLQKLVKGKIPIEKIKYSDGCCYCYIETGIENVHFQWHFDENESVLKICFHFEGNEAKKNKLFFDITQYFKYVIEEDTGEEVKNEEKYERNCSWYGIYIKRKYCELDEELKKWAVEKMNIFYHTINEEIKKVIKTLEKF